jgi:hypothetical protein
MIERSANLYDLTQAQQILSSLFPTAEGAIQERNGEDLAPNYLCLPQKFAIPSSARQAPDPAVASPAKNGAMPKEALHKPLSSWEECVDWCMNLTRAEAVFVADSQGFIIASRGKVPGQGFEGTGAELICSVERFERVAPDAGRLVWLDLVFDTCRVVGFITPPVDAEYHVLGLIAPDSSSFYSHKKLITRNLLHNLPNLD